MAGSEVGVAILGATQGMSAFLSFMPKFSDIRKNDPVANPEFAADVRMGELAAVTITMGIGLIASSLTETPTPAFVAALTCAGLVILYEYTLRANRPMEA